MKNFIEETVDAILAFIMDYDPYEYMDADIETEKVLLSRAIENGKDELIRERLSLYAEESNDTELIEQAMELTRRLDLISI